jgi:hypothetical protein
MACRTKVPQFIDLNINARIWVSGTHLYSGILDCAVLRTTAYSFARAKLSNPLGW